MHLYNTTVGITGGNNGLGLAIVSLLSKICKKIYVIDRSDACEEIKKLNNVEYLKVDLLKERPKPLEVDIFIGNVGMNKGPKLVKDYTYKEMEDMINLNIMSHLWCFKNMRYQKFVFIDSVLSFVGVEYYAMYCACKAFIRSFNESLQREGQDTLIVFPYKLNTGMFPEMKDVGTLQVTDVASSIKKAIEDEKKELFLPFGFRFLETFKGLTPTFAKNTLLNQVVKYFVNTEVAKEASPSPKVTKEATATSN